MSSRMRLLAAAAFTAVVVVAIVGMGASAGAFGLNERPRAAGSEGADGGALFSGAPTTGVGVADVALEPTGRRALERDERGSRATWRWDDEDDGHNNEDHEHGDHDEDD